MLAHLRGLPRGSTVAVVSMLGTLCPVTRAHVQMFDAARDLLLATPLLPQAGTPPLPQADTPLLPQAVPRPSELEAS